MSKPSDSAGSVVPAEVRELIEESRTIQGWMDRLSSHAGDARPEVFERVQSDYQARLDGVTGKLARHRTDLVGRLDARRSEVESLRSDRDSHQAELEEARLRHAVGEFSDSRWEDRRSSIEESLGELDALLEVEEGAVSELSGIIDNIGEGGTPATGVAAMAEAEIVVEGLEVDLESAIDAEETEVEEEPDIEEEPEAEVEAVAEAGPEEPESELEEEASEPEEEAEEPAVASAERPAATPPVDAGDDDADEEPGGEYLDELEFLESLSLDEADRFDAVSAMLDEEEQPPEA